MAPSKLSEAGKLTLTVGLGLLAFLAGFIVHLVERDFVSRAEVVEGPVVDMDCYVDEGTEMCAPVAEYVPSDGTPRRVTYSVSSSVPDDAVGDTVAIAYDPNDPDDAAFARFGDLWAGGFLLLVVGLALLVWALARAVALDRVEPHPRWGVRVAAGVVGAASYFGMAELIGPQLEGSIGLVAWGWIATVVVAAVSIAVTFKHLPAGARRDGVLAGSYGLLLLPISLGLALLLLPRSLWAGALAVAPVSGGFLVPAYVRFASAVEQRLFERVELEARLERALTGDGAEILVEVREELHDAVIGAWLHGEAREELHLARSVFSRVPIEEGATYLVSGPAFEERPAESVGYREVTHEQWIGRATSVTRAMPSTPSPLPWWIGALAVVLPIALTALGAWLVTVPSPA